ncbi:ulp1 protease family, C-terminal catalytic domain-containing protein [Tanacetum coccineum]
MEDRKGDKPVEAVDGESTDDDFVSSKKTKMNKVVGIKEKTSYATTTNGRSIADKETSMVKDKAAKDKVKRVNRIHSWIPPTSLFRVMTQLAGRQKQAVIDIGFGKVIDFKIKDIPTRLAYWLVDHFDEESCRLNVNGKEIEITRELVRDVLGVPLEDVHLDARDETQYRNPLTRAWKAHFLTSVKRHFTTKLADKMLSNGEGGWMFKINFLVLFFSTIGEANKNNTVNLKFLPCINSEADILKMDWCTYIIECLLKTKIEWNRKYHFNGPVILLLVLYASSYTPIKWCTSDVLDTLEKDKFTNEDGDDPDVNQESEDEGLDEEHVRENDEFGEYGPDRVPTDVEGMKKFVSAFLKRAAEMAELADDVLDEGLSLHPDDAGFVELKELRDQMFAACAFSQKPYKYQEPAEQTYDNCHTPWNGRTQHEDVVADGDELPFTQLASELADRVCNEFFSRNEHILTRLNFEEADFDLNITQPPATQGKEVGDGQNTEPQEPQDVPEFKTPHQPKGTSPKDRSTSRSLSRFGREYLSNENKSMIPVCSEPQPLDVLEPLIPQRRAKWLAIRPEVLRSPYVVREVSLLCGFFPHEKRVADCLFSARFTETYTDYCDGPRCVLETLYPGIKLASGAIDMFTHVLNDAERSKNKQTTPRLFCHTAVLTSEMLKWEHHKALLKFNENMELVLGSSQYKRLDAVELVLFLIISGSHFFVICMNLKYNRVEYLDNIFSTKTDPYARYGFLATQMVALFEDYLLHVNHPRYRQMSVSAEHRILTLGCRTTNNSIDCGVFVMRHMETYRGEGDRGDRCCLKEEGTGQQGQINELRYKYVAKILLADCNKAKSKFEQETHAFKTLPVEENKRLKAEAFEKIKQRAAQMLN